MTDISKKNGNALEMLANELDLLEQDLEFYARHEHDPEESESNKRFYAGKRAATESAIGNLRYIFHTLKFEEGS